MTNKTTEAFDAWWADTGEQSLYALNTTTDDDIKILAGLAWEAAIREVLAEQEKQEPVAWCDHVEHRLLTWRQSFVNRSGDQLALDDFMDQRSLEDLIDFVCDEYTAPTPRKPEPVEQEPVATDLMDMLRLIETIKYLRGIAERGLGREIREDETIEQFVLGYVKQLESTQPVKQEPVAVISESAIGLVKLHSNGACLPFGTKLYAAPVSVEAIREAALKENAKQIEYLKQIIFGFEQKLATRGYEIQIASLEESLKNVRAEALEEAAKVCRTAQAQGLQSIREAIEKAIRGLKESS